jgi:hypothetical protein
VLNVCSRQRALLVSFVASVLFVGLLVGLTQRPAAAAVTAVKGSACGYFSRVALPGSFLALRGCGQPGSAPATAASPNVTLPAGGSATPITATDANGAKATYDGTTFFGGQWSPDLYFAPASGPLAASTQGTPASGTVSSSVDITLSPTPLPVRCSYDEPADANCESPGGFGPLPVEGDELHVDCSATEAGVTGTTEMVNGFLATSTDEWGNVNEGEVIPASPPVNFTRSGVIVSPGRNPDTPGDIVSFTVVVNQQIVNADGSLTVTGVHLYLFGPGAVGEVVEGQVTCGTTPHPAVPADTVAPTCATTIVLPWGPDDASPTQPLAEMIGAVDAGGLQSITNIQVVNGTVAVGHAQSNFPYLRFSPGQTTPLQVTATRTQEAEDVNLSLYWSFDAVDKAGNVTHCKGVETPPVATNDAYTTNEDEALSVPAPGVLANDLPAGGALSAVVATGPAHGTLALNANGSFTYTPSPGYSGSDAFTYRVNDGSIDSNAATVALTVHPVDDPPSCSDATLVTEEDVAGSTDPVCSDVDGGTASYTIVAQPAHGTAAVVGGRLGYTPGPDFFGPDAFTYRADDAGGASNVATVSVTVNPVNDAPVAGDDTLTTNEDTTVTVPGPGVLANDTDVDSAALTAGSAGAALHGTVIVGADGSLAYTPTTNFNGTDTFTYVVDDGQGGTDTGLVTVTVVPVNDAPTAAGDAYVTGAGTPLTLGAPGVLGNDADVDGDALTAGSPSDPPGGSVSLSPDGSLTYTPDAGFSGTDAFTYVAGDGQGGSATATVTITVSPPQDLGPTTLSVSDLSVAEGSSPAVAATFTVSRSGNASASSTVKYRTSGGTATAGTDYTAVSTLTSLVFAPGERTRTVTVNVAGDSLPEADETFNLVLSAPTGAALADSSGTATIRNDDGAAYLAVGSVTMTEGSAGTTPVTLTITRSGNTTGPSTVKYATTNGTASAADFTAVPSTTVAFAPGETTKTVSVSVAGDAVDESNETFNLVLSAAVGAVISDTSGAATIVDDDGPVTPGPATYLSIGDLSVGEGNGGTTPVTFTVTRSGSTSGPSAVKYTTGGGTATAGTDYTKVPAGTLLSFAAGETTKTLTVAVAGDSLPEANETFNLTLSAATGATIADAAGTATILNDDGSAYLAVGDVTVSEGSTGTTSATFTVTRSGNTSGTSTVKVKTSGGTATAGTDYTAIATLDVTFAPGETSKAVTVAVAGDTVVEPTETFNLVLSSAVGATLSDASGAGKIVNDD